MSLTRLWRVLTILALLFAPLSMMSGHAAMAMSNASPPAVMDHGQVGASAGHCADLDQDQTGRTNPSIDCMIACSVIPTADFTVASRTPVHGVMPIAALPSLLSGLHPAADPPPPRLS